MQVLFIDLVPEGKEPCAQHSEFSENLTAEAKADSAGPKGISCRGWLRAYRVWGLGCRVWGLWLRV